MTYGQGVFVFSVVKYEPLVYMDYRYPAWGQGIGWLMALSSIIAIPGYAIYLFVVTPGTVRQVGYLSVAQMGGSRISWWEMLMGTNMRPLGGFWGQGAYPRGM